MQIHRTSTVNTVLIKGRHCTGYQNGKTKSFGSLRARVTRPGALDTLLLWLGWSQPKAGDQWCVTNQSEGVLGGNPKSIKVVWVWSGGGLQLGTVHLRSGLYWWQKGSQAGKLTYKGKDQHWLWGQQKVRENETATNFPQEKWKGWAIDANTG